MYIKNPNDQVVDDHRRVSMNRYSILKRKPLPNNLINTKLALQKLRKHAATNQITIQLKNKYRSVLLLHSNN